MARLRGGACIPGRGDLGSRCITAALGDAGFGLQRCLCPCTCLVQPRALCWAPHPLHWQLCGHSGETVNDSSLKSLISKYHVCCGLLSLQHCE